MVDIVEQRLRQRAVEPKLEALAECINREVQPTVTEIRQRFNEYVQALNPGAVVLTAGANAGYLEVEINGQLYSIELLARS